MPACKLLRQPCPHSRLGSHLPPRHILRSEQVKTLVAYAKARAVRVMLEIDTPGHAASWRYGRPDVMSQCPETFARHGYEWLALDPSVEATFEVWGWMKEAFCVGV